MVKLFDHSLVLADVPCILLLLLNIWGPWSKGNRRWSDTWKDRKARALNFSWIKIVIYKTLRLLTICCPRKANFPQQIYVTLSFNPISWFQDCWLNWLCYYFFCWLTTFGWVNQWMKQMRGGLNHWCHERPILPVMHKPQSDPAKSK